MKKYLHVLQEAIPTISLEDIDVPIKQTAIDSLDLVVIRVAIEKYFGFEVTDKEWYEFTSLGQALNHFDKHVNKSITTLATKPIELNRDHEIRMPQMANNALSENWLLKELGDIHWSLLSSGLEQKSSEFQDDIGNRLYATFVRINYSISPLINFKENETINFSAEIKRFGTNTYFSSVIGKSDGNSLRASLMTSFSQREDNDNKQILKTNLREKVNYIQEVKNIPELFNDYRLLKKKLLDELKYDRFNFQLTEEIISSFDYSINPYYDINGVGLLYFASYPIIADKCTSDYMKAELEIKSFENEFQTIYRDIFYFANCNSSDKVTFNLNSLEKLDEENLIITSSLFRHSDNKIMARIFTVKRRTR